MEDYISTIKVVRNSLSNDQKWKTRYDRYMTNLTDEKLERFAKAQKQFSVPAPFHLYMRLSTAVNECSSIRTYFELRFHGQSVAEILVYNDLDKEVFTAIKAPSNIIKTLKATGMNIEAEKILQYHCECYNESNIDQWLSWHSEQAKDFRKIYLDLENKIQSDSAVKKALGQPEHDMECELLKNYSQKSSAGKEILNIQPVMMGNTGARFQMPTAIKASTAKTEQQISSIQIQSTQAAELISLPVWEAEKAQSSPFSNSKTAIQKVNLPKRSCIRLWLMQPLSVSF